MNINLKKSLNCYDRAVRFIPGVSQLLSKKPDMFAPRVWPGYYTKASGVETTDLDGNRYTDMSISGIGACVLGFADPEVDAAVKEAVSNGAMCSLNCEEEVLLAELLCELHPWAERARFARTGGEAMAVAVRIARARTRRDKVVFCGYHGWHDWYLAANLADEAHLDGHLLPGLSPVGVPRGLLGTSLPFSYNKLDELQDLLAKNKGQIAAIVMEPIRDTRPAKGFLEEIRRLSRENGIVMIFDEITAGMRLCPGGAHLTFGVAPDIAVFAKAISNGYPMAAIVGTRDAMKGAEDSFISSAYWTERIGPVAALHTIKKCIRMKVSEHLNQIGKSVQEGWASAAKETGVAIDIGGIYPLSHFGFVGEGKMERITYFVQSMLDKGFLASGRFYASYAHTPAHVKAYLSATKTVFAEIASLKSTEAVLKQLRGPVAQSGFKRLT